MTTPVLLLSFFLFILACVTAAGYLLVLKPARAAGNTGAITPDGDDLMVLAGTPDLPAPQAALLGAFHRIGEALPPSIANRKKVRKLLLTAGYRWPSAVSMFLGIKTVSAFTLTLTAMWLSITVGTGAILLPAICAIGFGFLLPDRILERMATSRAQRLRRALPAALDLMLLGVEAGQGIDAAFLDTSRGLRLSYPDLAEEFTQLHLELRAGTARSDALRAFADRATDQEIRKFTSLLLDTDRFGSSLGPALRTHTHYLRTRFRQSAQERARKVGAKLIFPVFFLIFPTVMLVTLGPAAIMIFEQLHKMIGQ